MIINQAMLFFFVGLAVTVMDVLSCRLLHQQAGWNRYAANILSTSAAFAVSLVANRHLVFRPEHFEVGSGIVRFLVITLLVAWGIQNAVLWILARSKLLDPVLQHWFAVIAGMVGLKRGLLTGATLHKLVAICCGVTWNFCWYRWWVFA